MFSGVPTMARELLAHPDWDRRDTSTVQGLAGGGAPVQPDLVEKIDKTVGGAASTGYGLTETCGIVTANASRYYTAKPASCGPVMPTLDAKLVDENDQDLAAGPDTVGQLCVRGAVVAKGYLNRPDATVESMPDGWFHTGDNRPHRHRRFRVHRRPGQGHGVAGRGERVLLGGRVRHLHPRRGLGGGGVRNTR